jgi:hypothetical protein
MEQDDHRVTSATRRADSACRGTRAAVRVDVTNSMAVREQDLGREVDVA